MDELKKIRMIVWADAWVGVANVIDCKTPKEATKWADNMLKDFDERFNLKKQ